MQFVYDKKASQESLSVKDENYRYLFRARRLKVGDVVAFRNLVDDTLYHYKIEEIGKKEAMLSLQERYHDSKTLDKKLHILWCIIDTKVIEKTLPMLNQIGVSKITFFYCDRSQKNFKPDVERMQKILINSCQQSGRSDLMELEIFASMEEVLGKYRDFSVLDFGGEGSLEDVETIMIGCEGGFSENEREKLSFAQKIGLNTPLILKSETAALTFASKLLI